MQSSELHFSDQVESALQNEARSSRFSLGAEKEGPGLKETLQPRPIGKKQNWFDPVAEGNAQGSRCGIIRIRTAQSQFIPRSE